MIETTYRDLAEFGLPLITPGEPAFDFRVAEILSIPAPFGPSINRAPDRAAVLENQSENAVITLRYVWRFTDTLGETHTASHFDLGSSRQIDVLTGQEKARRELSSFILPGSRRLITEEGIFGDNRDVLGSPPQMPVGGWVSSHAGGGGGRNTGASEFKNRLASVQLELDLAIFEDGLCVGRDETGLRENLTEQVQRRIETAREIVQMLREGATAGQVFDMLRPLARHAPAMMSEGRPHTPLLSMFARSAVNRLMTADDAVFLFWVEASADLSPLRLHPPS